MAWLNILEAWITSLEITNISLKSLLCTTVEPVLRNVSLVCRKCNFTTTPKSISMATRSFGLPHFICPVGVHHWNTIHRTERSQWPNFSVKGFFLQQYFRCAVQFVLPSRYLIIWFSPDQSCADWLFSRWSLPNRDEDRCRLAWARPRPLAWSLSRCACFRNGISTFA